MTQKVKGNTRGLAPSQLREVQRLYERRVETSQIISLELARELVRKAEAIGRKIGVLLSREGRVVEVFLGTRELLYLPDLGRYRLGRGRLRRLRLVFSDLSKQSDRRPHIPGDIYADLERLRLDMVVAVRLSGDRAAISYAHLTPTLQSSFPSTNTELVPDLGRLDFGFLSFIERLAQEISAKAPHISSVDGGAMLVGVYGPGVQRPELSMSELDALARTAGVTVLETMIQRRRPDPKTVLGKGKLEEVVLRCLRLGADMLIFDCELRPGQWRIITHSAELKILDRSMLILDIFAQRATSSDGRLQVELAQLQYNLPRLVEKDAGLSRLTGGIGGRGPGETKLEIGRRRSRDRIRALEKRIERLSKQRQLRRAKRQRREVPLVSILGYTNAGKSTLFNSLTKGKATVENKLFATLDPSQGRLVVPCLDEVEKVYEDKAVVISDTVGFIRSLPDELKTAFRATIEELYEASLLVHVMDASDSMAGLHERAVQQILEEMGLLNIPCLRVFNKMDAVRDESVRKELCAASDAVCISACTGQGLAELKEAIVGSLFPQWTSCDTSGQGALVSHDSRAETT